MAKRAAKNRKLKIILEILKTIVIIFAVIFFLILLFFGFYYIKNKGNMKKTVSEVISSISKEEVEIAYALILGISEDIDTELTDTIIVAAYNPYTQNAYMFSIPRDTYIGNKDKVSKYDKINSIYSKYGIDKTIEYVEELTNLDINYYAIVKTSALTNIVDIIGGVEFEVPINMNYDDKTQNLHIHLKKGLQVLDGEKAEQLLRFRHNNNGTSYPYEYGDNDYGRMRTQREFIKETINQTIQLKNILKVKQLVSQVFENIETNMKLDKLLAYIPYGMEFDINNIQMEQLPGESVQKSGVWVFEKDEKKSQKVIEELENKLNNLEENQIQNTN